MGLLVDLAFSCAWKDVVILWSWFGLRYFPFSLQAFPTRKGPDFCSDWCSERNLPSSLQQLHGAAPAAPEPAGSGDRAQGTAVLLPAQPCYLLTFSPQAVQKVSFCCVSPGHSQPLGCPPFSPVHGHPKHLGVPSRSCFPAAFQLHGRVVLWLPSGLCPLHEARLCSVSRVADGILPWKSVSP